MKRGIHELSEYEKGEVAEDLMLPTGVFAAALLAGVLCLALVWKPHGLFSPAAPTSTSVVSRAPSPLDLSDYFGISESRPDSDSTTVAD
jgi:hypothetical protein